MSLPSVSEMSPKRLASLAVLSLVGASLLAAVPVAAQSRPVREFAGIDQHDPSAFAYAVRYGADLVKRDAKAEFVLMLGGRGVLLAVPGTNIAQRDYLKWRQGTGSRLKIIACRETMERLQKAVGRRAPVLPGVTVQPCNGRTQKMLSDGWRRMLGL